MFKKIKEFLSKKRQAPNTYIQILSIYFSFNVFMMLVILFSFIFQEKAVANSQGSNNFFGNGFWQVQLFMFFTSFIMCGSFLDHWGRMVPKKINNIILTYLVLAFTFGYFWEKQGLIFTLIAFGIVAFILSFNVVVEIKIELTKKLGRKI